jgi:hypothetical protein
MPPDPANALYHIRDQSAQVLLRPIAAHVGELEGRLGHYVGRIRMPDADRVVIAEARAALQRAQADLDRLVSIPSKGKLDG